MLNKLTHLKNAKTIKVASKASVFSIIMQDENAYDRRGSRPKKSRKVIPTLLLQCQLQLVCMKQKKKIVEVDIQFRKDLF